MARPTKDQIELGFWVVIALVGAVWMIAKHGLAEGAIILLLLLGLFSAMEGLVWLIRRLGR